MTDLPANTRAAAAADPSSVPPTSAPAPAPSPASASVAGPASAEVDAEASGSASASTHPTLPDPSLPAPSLPAEDVGFTAADLIARQARLEAQATEAIPFKFDTCTYSMGYLRQPIYACKTCGGGGVCAGCSISCHAEHDLVELFNKRHFRCDCGTPNLYRDAPPNRSRGKVAIEEQLEYPAGAPPCTLRKPGFDPQNEENRYNHNFEGRFCYCVRGRTYDPEKEDETMFQCLVCEEWLHESCTSLRPGPPSKTSLSAETGHPSVSQPSDEGEPPLIDHDLFDLMICDACVRKDGSDLLRSYAGSRGWMLLLPSQQCDGVTSWDGIPSIKVPTEESKLPPPSASTVSATIATAAVEDLVGKERESRPLEKDDEPSWQLFGLSLDHGPSDTVASGSNASQTSKSDHGANEVTGPLDPDTQQSNGPASLDSSSGKRKADTETAVQEEGTNDSAAKRLKVEPAIGADAPVSLVEACMLPRTIPLLVDVARSTSDEYVPALATEVDARAPPHRYDVFLSEDFRDRICKCASCLPRWRSLPFVLESEATYSPPSDREGSLRVDDDAASVTSSTYDLGMAALRSMPREKMINSLQAYNKFRDALWEHLRPFAGSGKAVSEEDVRAFFKNRLRNADADAQ